MPMRAGCSEDGRVAAAGIRLGRSDRGNFSISAKRRFDRSPLGCLVERPGVNRAA